MDRLEQTLRNSLGKELDQIPFPDGLNLYHGKVRDCVVHGNGTRTLITTDRLSAFDRQICLVPFKGQILNRLSCFWLEKTKHIVPNHLISMPHPNCMHSREVEIIPIEVVVRKYLTGSAWRDYQKGNPISGITLPPGLEKDSEFPDPILTPSTKAEIGDHDEPISEAEILSRGLVSKDLWNLIRDTAFKLFKFGQEHAKKQGLTLVDTKYEFGLLNNELILADEVHTPDSSRYWHSGEMLDKEYVRSKLMELGYSGEGEVPKLSEDFIIDLALRYAKNFELLTGEEFVPELTSAKEILVAIQDLHS